MPPPFDAEQLLRQHGGALRQLASLLLRDRNDVDDVVQETWLRGLRSPPRHGEGLGAWLATVLHNVVRRTRRASARRHRHEAAAAATSMRARAVVEDHAVTLAHADVARRLLEAVTGLEPPYREVVWARFFEGLTPREIASRSGVSVATVKSQLQRGLGKLRERLGESGAEWRGAMSAAFGIGSGPLAAVGAASGGAGVIGGGVLMATWMKGVAVAAAVAIAWVVWWPREDVVTQVASAGPGDAAAAVAAAAMPSGAAEAANGLLPAERVEAMVAAPAVDAKLATIRGRCVDEDGVPLAGVAVRLDAQINRFKLEEWLVEHDAPEPMQRELAPTSADGQFTASFAPVAVLDYRLLFKAAGHESAYHPLTELAVGPTDVGEIRMERGVLVRGRVVDAGGAAIGDVQVELRSADGAAKYRAARADGAGFFDLQHVLRAGTYQVTVSDGFAVRSPEKLELSLFRPIEDVLVKVDAPAGPSIHGRVLDQDGRPLPRARIEARQRDGRVATRTSTGADGTFVLRGVEVDRGGAVAVAADAKGYLHEIHQKPVAWGSKDLEIRLQMERPLTVRVEDSDGNPVSRCVLTLADPDPTKWGSGRGEPEVTDERGLAVFRGVRPGARFLIMNHPRARGLPPAIERLAWDGGDAPVVVRTLSLAQRRVRVVDSRGEPCVGAVVSLCELFDQEFGERSLLLQPGKWFSVMGGVGKVLVMETWTTDAEGVCRARAPARAMGLLVFGPGFVTKRLSGVRLDHPGELLVTVERGARVRGVIRPDGGMDGLRRLHRLTAGAAFPAGQAPVLCLLAERTKVPGFGDADRARYEVLPDGRFDIGGLPPGRWTLAVEYWVVGDNMETSRTFPVGVHELADGQVLDVDVDVTALLPGTLQGTVLRDGRPVANAMIMVRTELGTGAFGSDDHEQLLLETDGQGCFEHTGRTGRCRVRMATGGAWSVSSVDIVRGQTVKAVFELGGADLTIVLRKHDGSLAVGVSIEPDHGNVAVTDSAGRAQLRVEVGEVKVRVLPRSLQTAAARQTAIQSGRGASAHDPLGKLWIELAVVTVVNGETKQLELRLPPEWEK